MSLTRPDQIGVEPELAVAVAVDPPPPGATDTQLRLPVQGADDRDRSIAARDTWTALWRSRLVVWAAGISTLVILGGAKVRNAFDPPNVTGGFGRLVDLLAAPAARWDAAWYLVIARYGYRSGLGVPMSSRAAFFPLYPLGLRAISDTGVPPILAGVMLSLGAFAAAMYGIHRLVTLELAPVWRPTDVDGGRRAGHSIASTWSRRHLGVGGSGTTDVARLAVMITAFSPMAFFFSAVYSESMYMALSVGLFWAARNGRWILVALAGALASATRSAGLILLVPAVIIYLYGPREDRSPDFPRLTAPTGVTAGLSRAGATLAAILRPRYRLRKDVLWLAVIPVGVLMYMAYLSVDGGSALMPFNAQQAWNREFVGPYLGVWNGAVAAFDGLRQLLSMQTRHVYFPLAGGSPTITAEHNLLLFAFLLAAIPAIVGILRTLPFAYGAYVVAALALPLSYPVTPQPLMSLPRFLVVLFPLSMWAAIRLADHPRARVPVLVASAVAMAFFVGEFSSWHWVA